MKTILKKNQIIISVVAIMLIAAGYMNYTTNDQQLLQTAALADTEKYGDLGDATLVSGNVTDENKEKNANDANNESKENKDNQNKEENTNIVESSAKNNNEENNQYFIKSRLDREKMYSQMIESYEKILSNNQISKEQKAISENEIKNINNTKNAIMITENLLKNKGFEDLIIFVNGDSINVVIKAEDLKEEDIAKIQNIVSREMKQKIENIHISCKK